MNRGEVSIRIRRFIGSSLFAFLPETNAFGLKRCLLRLCGYEIGYGVRIASSARLRLARLTVGDGCWIGHQVLIVGGHARVVIGDNVDIAPRVLIAFGTHEIGDCNRRAGLGASYDVEIGSGSWIGAGAIILGGVKIGTGCIVAAGGLVQDDVEDNSLVGGVPARLIRRLVK